jgi:hypothetical protein
MSKPSPIPDWLKPTLKRHIAGEAHPDTMDFQIVSAALAGVELDALKKRFDLGADEILKSVRRVAEAVRENAVEGKVFDDYPDLSALRTARKPPKKEVRGPRSEADVAAQREALAIMDADLPEIIPGDDKSLHEFLVAAKANAAKTLVPAAFRALQQNIDSLDGQVSNAAIAKTLETYLGVGRRGPGVAIQQNFGEHGEQKAADTPHFFEETILAAETEEGSVGGEITVFDERLLGLQEEETK